MKTVYAVTAGSYSDFRYLGVFSSEQKAQQYIDKRKAGDDLVGIDINGIEEFNLDEALKECEYPRWCVDIRLDNGAVMSGPSKDTLWGIPSSLKFAQSKCGGNPYARGISHKSGEHALKLAIEARQEYLRNATPPVHSFQITMPGSEKARDV
jgi:hypothetical protein